MSWNLGKMMEAKVHVATSKDENTPQAAKALGNIGAESSDVVPELLRLLRDDSDSKVRTEAAHALGKIGEKAAMASKTLISVVSDPAAGDVLRGEADPGELVQPEPRRLGRWLRGSLPSVHAQEPRRSHERHLAQEPPPAEWSSVLGTHRNLPAKCGSVQP